MLIIQLYSQSKSLATTFDDYYDHDLPPSVIVSGATHAWEDQSAEDDKAASNNASIAIPASDGLPSSTSVPITETIPHSKELIHHQLHLSLKQHISYFSKKDKLLRWLQHNNRTNLLDFGQVSCMSCFAVILNEKYAFRHIYKTGGTAVMAQAGQKEVREAEYGNRFLVATVRDPIDHFLSGWAECGKRSMDRMENKTQAALDINAKSYDDRVFSWLERAKKHQYNTPKKWYTCINHSLPQANYLLVKTEHPGLIQQKRRGKQKHGQSHRSSNYFHPKVDIVGDMYELPGLLGYVGFTYNETIEPPNNATSSTFKSLLWPKDKSLLSNRTVDALCEFLALDYYLFDFPLPTRCQGWLGRDREDIDNS